MKWGIKLVLILFCTYGFVYGQDNISLRDITVLNKPADNMMKDYLTSLVDGQFFVRDSLLSTLRSAKDWNLRSQTIRDSMVSWTGPFPESTPLNARITGRLERKEYVVENILFESRQNFFVSANLYLPKNVSFPRPAVLNVIGHSSDGKTSVKVQMRSIAQARKGFIVLTMDCLGQGERQVNDYTYWGNPPGNAHQIIGIQAFISGTHVFNFMVWDAIRAIDYLISRPEVNAEKICITGCSGGGMMSTYILPFEPRIAVAMPACNPNTWSYRIHANLSTDHEQVFFGAFAGNIDPRGDPLFTQVPKPLLINATTEDQLNPPRGVWDLSTWLFKSYSAHGVPEKLATTMVEAPHGYNMEQREFAYSWMLRWTGGDATDFWEEDIPIEKDEDLWATNTGSVYDEPGSNKPQKWVLDYLSDHKAELGSIKTQKALNGHRIKMISLIESVLNTDLDNISVKVDLEKTRLINDIIIRPFVLKPEEGIVLPGILLEPNVETTNQDVILYINQNGKSNILNDMDIVEEMLRKGNLVCAVDLRGTGETSPDLANKFWDFLAGKPIFGQRVYDILAMVKWLKESEIKAQNIKLWGTGMGALYGAFAGVFCDDITEYLLEEPLISFESVVQVPKPEYENEIILPGILEKFDMPQVYQALCPRPVTLLNPLLGDKSIAGKSDTEKLNEPLSATYRRMKNQKAWSLLQEINRDERSRIISSF
jgi:dienelactone hydrolase